MKSRLRLRPGSEKDARFYWHLRNEPSVREASFQTKPIPWSEHKRWFSARMANGKTRFFVAESAAKRVGQIRVEPSRNKSAEISLAVAAR